MAFSDRGAGQALPAAKAPVPMVPPTMRTRILLPTLAAAALTLSAGFAMPRTAAASPLPAGLATTLESLPPGETAGDVTLAHGGYYGGYGYYRPHYRPYYRPYAYGYGYGYARPHYYPRHHWRRW
jgi:hypothetical protein